MNKLKGYCKHVFFALAILGYVGHASSNTSAEYTEALNSWAEVLAGHVDDKGRISFTAVAANPVPLKRYIDVIESYGPATNPDDFVQRNSVLAYHANTYNALAMWGVIERDIPAEFNSFFKRASFFRFRGVTIAGEQTNLYDYENKVIRPLGDPRLHFALNCMVRDCPRLPQEPFLAETIDQQLEAAALEFFDHPRKLEIDHDKKLIRVSSILDFYTEDFVGSGKANDLPDYINRYLDVPLPEGYKVKFIKYDWRINSQPQ